MIDCIDDMYSIKTSTLVQMLFDLLKVKSFKTAAKMYSSYENKLRESQMWEPTSEIQMVNRAKNLLLAMDPSEMKEEEYPECHIWRAYMLASWYERTMKFLLYFPREVPEDNRFELAVEYVRQAREIRWFENDERNATWRNRARLWKFLVNGDIDEAHVLIESLPPHDAKIGKEMILEYYRYRDHVPQEGNPAPA